MMTTIEKDLLLKDLSARLPYGVKCRVTNDFKKYRAIAAIHPTEEFGVLLENNCGNTSSPISVKFEDIKPYLFPLSSMTEEQKEEFNSLTTSIEAYPFEIGSAIDYNMDRDINEYSYVSLEDMLTCIDWLNAHHFDYRGLIGKQLAIDATDLNIY